MAAGLLARAACERGLRPKRWVKTSLAPGSPSARRMLQRAGLGGYLSNLGFDVVGHGCTTCIGNSGPLPDMIKEALASGKALTAVLSGNRNFPGRVHPKLDLGYLASPPLVVAYALSGHIHGDITKDVIGYDPVGRGVRLTDIWPSADAVTEVLPQALDPRDVPLAFSEASRGLAWEAITAPTEAQFPWDPASRYLRRPRFAARRKTSRLGAFKARPLLVLGDDMTTDHISPAGWIAPDSAAASWLIERGGDPDNLNVYAAYRGNCEVMLRGLFTNRLVRNYLEEGLSPS